jgi:hypothetical protein
MKLRKIVVVGALAAAPFMTRLVAQGPIQVNSTAMAVSPSDGLCTLPEAINSANSDAASGPAAGECRAGLPGLDTIALPAGSYTSHAVYTVFPVAGHSLGLPVVRSPIEIVGDSAATSIIERSSAAGTPEFRLFYVQYTGFAQYELTGSLVLRRVTVRNGKIGEAGGAIYIQNTNQTANAVIDSVVSDNESTWGGAVYAGAPLLTIRNSTIERNRVRAGGSGAGAIFVTGTLVVEHSRFEGNRSEASGGVASVGYLGSMDISDSIFIRNSAKNGAGALDTAGATLTITRSWLHANRAENSGGAIGAERLNMSVTTLTDNVSVTGNGGGASVTGSAGWTVVRDSTFTGNVAGSTGGGIYAGPLEMTNTTVSGNQAKDSGGGISVYGTTNTYLKANNITVTNNVVTADAGLGGGVSFGAAVATLANSIIAGNVVGADQRAPDCWGWLTAQSAGHNLIGNNCGCSFAALATDQVGTWHSPIDPRLGALQANGGPTLTHLPLAGSLAIDSASPLAPGSEPTAAAVLDQRGVARPQDGDGNGTAVSDRGATELAGDPFPTRPSFSVATYSADEPGGSVDITVRRADGTGDVAMLYSAVSGSATPGPDYLAVSGGLTLLHGETTKTFSVSILDDTLREGTESVRLELRSPGAAVDSLPVSSAILFIKDDDAFPLFRTIDAAADEGHSGTRDVHVSVGLYAAYPFNVSVSYSTENGTAVAGQDYDAASGVVTIGGGTTSTSFVVKVRGDLVDEPDEYFRVKLLTTIGCVSEIRYATVTIRDDDLPNRPPVLTKPADRTDFEGDAVTLGVIASDPNVDPLTYTSTGLPPGLAIDAQTGVIAGTVAAGSAGTYTAGVTVSDGELSASASFVWTVAVRNGAPQLTNPGPLTNVEGDTPSLALKATDPDGDKLTYGASGLPPGLTIDAATGVSAGSLGYTSAGTYTVIATATDPKGAVDSETFTWKVNDTNRPPSLLAPADRTNLEGDSASLQLIATDLDLDTLTYGATGLPPGIAIDATTGAIAGTLPPASQGSYPVNVTVSDGKSTTTQSFRWIVTILTPSNRLPVCQAARPSLDVLWPPNHKQTHAVGVLGVTDPDGDAISIAITAIWQDEPTNTVGDGNTPIDGYGVGTSQADVRAERSGTPQVPGDGRLYEIFFTAKDGAGGSCSGVVRVGVPHDMSQHRTVVDSLVRYDSTTGMKIK